MPDDIEPRGVVSCDIELRDIEYPACDMVSCNMEYPARDMVSRDIEYPARDMTYACDIERAQYRVARHLYIA